MEIVFEDNHIIAINKKPGDIVQGDKTGDKPLSEKVKHYLKTKYNKPGNVFLGVTHRLDRPTSGIVLFAKTGKALSRLNAMFRDNKIQKKYWAVVNNKPPKNEDTIVHYLVRNPKQNKSYAYDIRKANAKEATLTYKLIAKSLKYYLLEIELHTGRHHQIRAQFAKLNCYIKGDLKYGFPRSNPDGGIHLHAREVVFVHPVKKESITIIAAPPDDKLWQSFLE